MSAGDDAAGDEQGCADAAAAMAFRTRRSGEGMDSVLQHLREQLSDRARGAERRAVSDAEGADAQPWVTRSS